MDETASRGFALPLLRIGGQDQPWLTQQVSEASETVLAFQPIEAGALDIHPIPSPILARVGEPQVYVFVDEGNVRVGPRSLLAPFWLEFTRTHPQNLEICLQIFELIGSADERRVARSRMRGAIAKSSGAGAAASFYRSSLESAFWMRLVSAWGLEQSPERLNAIRMQFEIELRPGGKIEIHNVEPIDSGEAELLAGIIRDLEGEFEHLHVDSRMTKADIQDEVEKRLKIIRNIKRQEERIAIILSEIIRNRTIGMQVFSRYKPRAQFESAIVDKIRRVMQGSLNDELSVANLIRPIFTACFPMQRGYILVKFSEHLATFPLVNAAIERQLRRTASIYTAPVKDYVRQNLALGAKSRPDHAQQR